jgi:PAS domain S-box-containing protein
MENSTNENQALRRSLRDLVALTSLPSVWAGSTPHQIAESLSDVLLSTCPHLDMIYVFLKEAVEHDTLQLVRTPQKLIIGKEAEKLGEIFSPWLTPDHSNSKISIPDPLNDGSLDISVIPIGHSANTGYVVAAVRPSRTITELDRLLLSVAVNQAVTALQQARLLTDLKAANRLKDMSIAKEQAARERVMGLQIITAAFSQSLTVDQVARVIVEQTITTIKAESAVCHVLQDQDSTQTMQFRRWGHPSENRGVEKKELVEAPAEVLQVIHSQRPLWLESPIASAAILPLVINQEALGTIEYHFPYTQALKEEERDFMLVLAQQCAQALERARLYEVELEVQALLQTRVRLQSIIADLGQEALVSFDLSGLMDKAAVLLTKTLGVEFTKILELLPEENCFLLRAGTGWKKGYVGHRRIGSGYESQSGYTLMSHTPVIVEDLHTETRFKGPALLLEHHVVSGVSVIIQGHEGPWGVLGVHSKRQRSFTSNDIYFVQSIANILGAALERARLDATLKTERQRLSNILATVPGVIWENRHTDEDAEMKLVFISAYVETMLGYTVEEALAEPHFWLKIFHPEDAQKTVEAFNRVRKSGSSGIINFRAIHKNGRVLDIHALMIAILKDKKPVGKRGVMMDVTEHQRLVKAQTRYATMLRRSNDELQQFAYVASHDLQEPLRLVTSYLQILESRYSDKLDSDAHEFIAFAVDGAARMKALITDLLTYSRVDGAEKAFVEFDMQNALDKALANLSLKIEDSKALITHDNLPRIRADRVQIIQLFQNLIGNAIKFQRGRTPQIHISAEQKGSEWLFGVHDNGIGIAPEFLERIFVIFQRLHRREEYPGTGIGLAICKKVVERHGGQIWVESVLGEGTTFYFTLPIQSAVSTDELSAISLLPAHLP